MSTGVESGYVDDRGAQAYALARHGPDGAVLLDPGFQALIERVCPGKEVVDIGCGAAPWAIYAVRFGGATAVRGFDNSPQMRDQAGIALAKEPAEMAGKISVEEGTVRELPVEDGTFPVALSLNVGCALPSYESDEKPKSGTLKDHLAEMRRVLTPGGFGIVTAPVSLETVFTTFGDEEAKVAALEEAISLAEDAEAVRQTAKLHTDVLRATIIEEDCEFRVAPQAEELRLGQQVMRIIPGLVVPNYVHTGDEYDAAINDAGLQVMQKRTPLLTTQECEDSALGLQYTLVNPFAIYLLRNPS